MEAPSEILVYWQPGCTSCLRTKEFLTKHGVAFTSRNVLSDAGAMDAHLRAQRRRVIPQCAERIRGGRRVLGDEHVTDNRLPVGERRQDQRAV